MSSLVKGKTHDFALELFIIKLLKYRPFLFLCEVSIIESNFSDTLVLCDFDNGPNSGFCVNELRSLPDQALVPANHSCCVIHKYIYDNASGP